MHNLNAQINNELARLRAKQQMGEYVVAEARVLKLTMKGLRLSTVEVDALIDPIKGLQLAVDRLLECYAA